MIASFPFPVLTLRRADLVAAGACAEWLAVFDAICALRGDDRAPLVRLRVELTPLAQLWMARDARGAVQWLRERSVLGPVFAPRLQAAGIDFYRADLRGAYLDSAYLDSAYLDSADLRGAYLRGADLRGAYLDGAYLDGAYLDGAYLRGAYLRGADLHGAYLRGADLRGADLRGARRWSTDPAIPGWVLRDGMLAREVAA